MIGAVGGREGDADATLKRVVALLVGLVGWLVWSSPNLDPANTFPEPEVYVKDLVTGDLMPASISDTGVEGNQGGWSPILSADGTTLRVGGGHRDAPGRVDSRQWRPQARR